MVNQESINQPRCAARTCQSFNNGSSCTKDKFISNHRETKREPTWSVGRLSPECNRFCSSTRHLFSLPALPAACCFLRYAGLPAARLRLLPLLLATCCFDLASGEMTGGLLQPCSSSGAYPYLAASSFPSLQFICCPRLASF